MKRMHALVLLVVVLSGCAPTVKPGAVPQASNLDAGIAALAERMSSRMGPDHGLRIAVLPFVELQSNAADPFGKYLAEGLIAHLARDGRYPVIERELLNKVLEEHRLGMLGVLDEASAKKMGAILGVGAVVTGTYSTLDSRVKVNARLISTANGLIIATAETDITRDREVEQLLGTSSAPQSLPAPQPRPAQAALPAPKDAVPVQVSLLDGRFFPVNFVLPSTHTGCTIPMSDLRPSYIRREPRYAGALRRYGTITLGTRKNPVFAFALDITPGEYGAFYLDRNQNGDLTDDGGPLMNQARPSGYFSAPLSLPFSRIMDNAPFPEYQARIFVNETSWHQNRMCYYSTTQFKGSVAVGGASYLAYIVEFGDNDADFTNDGIYLDLNQDQRIDTKTERIAPGSAASINGKNYVFAITAGRGAYNITGTWKFVCCSGKYWGEAELAQEGNKIQGQWYDLANKSGGAISGSINGDRVLFSRANGAQDYNVTLSADGNTMQGFFVGNHDGSVGTEVTLTRK